MKHSLLRQRKADGTCQRDRDSKVRRSRLGRRLKPSPLRMKARMEVTFAQFWVGIFVR